MLPLGVMHENTDTNCTGDLAAEKQEREMTLEGDNPYKAYQQNTEALAARAFEKHMIKSRGDGRWVIAKKYEDGAWCGFYMAEVIVGVHGTLIVHGDISPVMFGHYSGYTDPLQVVGWVAYSGISSYLQSKAHIAFCAPFDRDLTKSFNPDVAIWELKDRLKDRLQELEDYYEDVDEIDDPEVAAWRKAIRGVGGDAWEMVRHELYDDLEDAGCCDVGEMIWDIGEVPAARLYYAQAACRRLLELLDAEKQEEETKLKAVVG